MTMTQRYAGTLRRLAKLLENDGQEIRAGCCRGAAQHMEQLQTAHDALLKVWQPIETAPKDGSKVMVLLNGSGLAGAAYLARTAYWHELAASGDNEPAGWWADASDSHPLRLGGDPRYWMPISADPNL